MSFLFSIQESNSLAARQDAPVLLDLRLRDSAAVPDDSNAAPAQFSMMRAPAIPTMATTPAMLPASWLASSCAARLTVPNDAVNVLEGRQRYEQETAFVPSYSCHSRGTSQSTSQRRLRRPRENRSSVRMQDFSSPAYWNELYRGESKEAADAVREWHVDPSLVVEPLERLLGGGPPAEGVSILNVGCGTSTLWESLYDHGWRNITNIDFSAACIQQGAASCDDRPGVRWMTMDACDLKFSDATFDAAVDKGTMDAIACSEAFDWLIPRMAASIVRVLRPGRVWLCVSFSPPKVVLSLLAREGWLVDVERLESFWVYVGKKTRQ